MALTNQKISFAEAYISRGGKGHGTEAAIEAGYSERSAHSQASRLLKDAEVLAYIRGRMRDMRADDRIAKPEEVMRFFSAVMRGEVKDQFDLDPQLADRLKGGVELMKRYNCIEDREIAARERAERAREREENAGTGGVVFSFVEEEGGGADG